MVRIAVGFLGRVFDLLGPFVIPIFLFVIGLIGYLLLVFLTRNGFLGGNS